MKSEDDKLLSFRVPPEIYDAIVAEAKKRGISTSRLMRLALADHLEAEAWKLREEAANG